MLKETKDDPALKQLAEDSIREFRTRVTQLNPTRELEISTTTLVLILLVGIAFITVGLKVIQKKILSMSESLQQTNSELNKRLQTMQIELTNFNEINKHANSIYTIDYAGESLRSEGNLELRDASFLGKRAHVYILRKPVEEQVVDMLGHIYQDQPNYICKVLYLFESD